MSLCNLREHVERELCGVCKYILLILEKARPLRTLKFQTNLGGLKVYRGIIIIIYLGFIHRFRLLQRYPKPQLNKEKVQIKVRC
jgi:hypothetical protein